MKLQLTKEQTTKPQSRQQRDESAPTGNLPHSMRDWHCGRQRTDEHQGLKPEECSRKRAGRAYGRHIEERLVVRFDVKLPLNG